MNIVTCNKILKISGILSLIAGIVGTVLGVMIIIGGGLIDAEGGTTIEGEVTLGAFAIVAGIMLLCSGIIALLEGIFSMRAAKNNEKITPAWIFSILGLISSAVSLISNIIEKQEFTSSIITVLLSALIFVAANTIRNSVKQ